MKGTLSHFILMEAIIVKINYEISMLMSYYHTITYTGPKRISCHQ